MYVYTYVRIIVVLSHGSAYVCRYLHIYTSVCVYIYACIYVCTHTYVHTRRRAHNVPKNTSNSWPHIRATIPEHGTNMGAK